MRIEDNYGDYGIRDMPKICKVSAARVPARKPHTNTPVYTNISDPGWRSVITYPALYTRVDSLSYSINCCTRSSGLQAGCYPGPTLDAPKKIFHSDETTETTDKSQSETWSCPHEEPIAGHHPLHCHKPQVLDSFHDPRGLTTSRFV